MKSLSLTQPWATLMAIGAKTIETRGWPTKYRGLLAIHAAKGLPVECRQLRYRHPYQSVLADGGYGEARPLPLGVIVAVVEVFDCRPFFRYNLEPIIGTRRASELQLPPHELDFGDFTEGRYGFLTRNVQRLRVPVEHRGHQGIRDLPPDVEERVRAQLVQR